ncbi:MAG TPA: cytochrome P450 [Myxococcales bacterium]|nr:cytochrome P450 [Myxococcales bacterium]
MTDIDGFELIAPKAYGAHGVPHDHWRELRKLDWLHHCKPEGFDAFYPVVRHDQICEISKQPDRFLNGFGIVLESTTQKEIIQADQGIGQMRVIIGMDPPEHRDYRKVAASWFTPRAIDSVAPIVEESARTLVDTLVQRASGGEGECEFASEVAAAHPLRVLSTILGVPREKEPQLLRLTNELFGSDDPDLQREGEDRSQAVQALAMEFFQLFSAIIEDRRANPTDDLASLLANGKVNGEPLGIMETLGYYLITFTAGHDTTKNALAGGIRALAEHPAEYEKLKRNPDLVPSAVEEIVRWTSPVNYMKRVVAEDLEFRGQKLRKGDNLVLFYASANRDEQVFEDPYTFRIDRDPNPHLAFGIGEHFCLGTHLARQSQRALLRELIGRIDTLELAGDPVQIASSFVVGLKKLPIRYRLSEVA